MVEKARVIENDALPRVVERWRADANTVLSVDCSFNVTICRIHGPGIALDPALTGSGEQGRRWCSSRAWSRAARRRRDRAGARRRGRRGGGRRADHGRALTEVRGSGMAFDVELRRGCCST